MHPIESRRAGGESPPSIVPGETRGAYAPRSPWLALSALLCVLPLFAADPPQPDTNDPETERKSFQVADGFEVNLFAADPVLAKPIQMNFDAAGRLWVATSEVYPQIKPGQKADDKIVVLHDTDGDGKADKTTVFADGLLIPTGVEPGDGGVYVANSTDLVFMQDTDGDGKADKRTVLLSGFGTEDTHHILHTLRWGPDGMLYMNQSTYIHSHIETPHGVRRLNGGGIWQFRPQTQRLEVFMRGLINPWGHHFDRFGQSFATDGAGGEGINYVVPGGYYAWAIGGGKIMPGLNPGSPKYCGLELLSGSHLPDEWQGNHITNDFRGHRVCRFVVAPEGAGYTSRQQADLIKTNHPAFRPIDVKVGPDGAIYIADWYNPIIQHGEVDFRDERRDHTRGRIWRITAKGRPTVKPTKLVGASVEELVEALGSPEEFVRHRARLTLKERHPRNVVPVLEAWADKHAEDEPKSLDALWAFQAIDVPNIKQLNRAAKAKDARVRAAALRVAGEWVRREPDAVRAAVDRLKDDEHPQVRLEAVRYFTTVPGPNAVELAMSVLDKPTDKWIDYGLYLTLRERQKEWLPLAEAGKLTFGGKVDRILFAVQSAGAPSAAGILAKAIKEAKLTGDDREKAITVLARQGGPAELAVAYARAIDKDTSPDRRAELLALLTEAAKGRGAKPEGDVSGVADLAAGPERGVRLPALRLVGLWKVEKALPKLADAAKSTDDDERRAGLDALVALATPAARDELEKIGTGPATAALAGLDPARAAKPAAALLAGDAVGLDAQAVTAAFLGQKGGPEALAAALEGKKVPTDTAKMALRAVRSAGKEYPTLTAALTKAGGLTAGPRKLSADELKELVAAVGKDGDPAAGERVYRRAENQCMKCHAVAGAGGLVGPDLSSIGASAPVDYLIESILVPNKAVKEGYHTLLVTTTEGKQLSGIKVRQGDDSLVIRTPEGEEVTIPKDKIDETANGASLMPEGLADAITRRELVDLVRFLSEMGKVGPYSVPKTRLLRRWQTIAPADTARAYLSKQGVGAVGGTNPALTWESAYATVGGELPLIDVPQFEAGPEKRRIAAVRGQFDVSTPGKLRLTFASLAGVTAWIDGKPAKAEGDSFLLDLPAGRHTLTLAVDLTAAKGALRCELADEPGSPARAEFVGGR